MPKTTKRIMRASDLVPEFGDGDLPRHTTSFLALLSEKPWCPAEDVAPYLDDCHYLGAAKRGFAYADHFGAMVFAKPTSRRLPQDGTWLELLRWCLFMAEQNDGSMQWSEARQWLLLDYPNVTTIVSYSDPSVGHTGALYKASGWLWAPTWHRLRPPPSGNGSWQDGKQMAVKDRWVYPLHADERRAELLAINDASLVKRGHVGYQETFRGPRLRKSRGDHPRNTSSTLVARSTVRSKDAATRKDAELWLPEPQDVMLPSTDPTTTPGAPQAVVALDPHVRFTDV